MYGILDEIIKDILYSNKKFNYLENSDPIEDIKSKEIKNLYEKILDKVVISMFNEYIENELLYRVFLKLTRVQRMIIVFHILLDFNAKETAEILGNNEDSIYSQKYKALKRFKEELSKV